MPRFPGFKKSGGAEGWKGFSARSNDPAPTPHERKRDNFLQLFKPKSRNPSPNPSSSALQLAVPGSKDLWTEAYHKLPDELKKHLGVKEPDKLQILQNVLQAAIQAKEANMANRRKLKWGSHEINVQETADRLVGWIAKFKEVGDIAMQYDPVHAALPWAGVRFILLLVVGEQEKLAAAIAGMERIAELISRCAIYEGLYLTDDVLKGAEDALEILRRGLLTLYTAILQTLCRLIRVFEGKLIDKLKTPEATLSEIRAVDGAESAVNSAVIVVENCCTRPKTLCARICVLVVVSSDNYSLRQVMLNQDQLEEFDKLRELLKDFVPVISRINNNVEEIYKDIEENKRITVLRWFSTVPYQSHHDLACEGRVEHTGTWLFKKKEFISWENSKTPAILWLHGIPLTAHFIRSAGAGKTKLVSATIEYLNAIAKFDKVAFFYCKRDEADHQDVKTNGRTRICAEALGAYNKEQNDPSSRRQLSFDSTFQLLGHLVECFEHPAVVLDALDECSEEVRGHLLRGLLSVTRKVKCPLKIFIASRHNLDIENNLRDLPHVCIEAQDNAEDIENYVRQQLTLRIQDKRLLQGNVSHELRNCIENIILRDANGMFLWVDWQLRELCKLIRESDIRARLGKLPKGLTGVYDEIMNSIKSQPDCNVSLATHALMWMLVSERPLTPSELVAAAELHPSTSIAAHKFHAPSQQTTLAVELLIHSCEGLLQLDKQLDVVRFSHLSVQEYLETGNEIWNIIDAQLLVSESCLWTLQSSLEVPLYDYAARNWFLHCRSYQDLVLSAANLKDNKHKLRIPLLDRFLGSFKQASASYVKWADWVGVHVSRYDYLFGVRSTPLCPAFSAAFAGLGELVSWLWDSVGNDMKVQNDHGNSLLDVASRHGTAWIVAKVLNGGFEISDVQNALYTAVKASKLSIIKLLLDQGADVNLPAGNHGTALGAAVYRINSQVRMLSYSRTGGRRGLKFTVLYAILA
ncbi:hypothetical protein EV426DRAFT_709670 [Tirmania nivea]|nr:hypothetical protein EV426DRAFT_709670 [Tirmania nivea]